MVTAVVVTVPEARSVKSSSGGFSVSSISVWERYWRRTPNTFRGSILGSREVSGSSLEILASRYSWASWAISCQSLFGTAFVVGVILKFTNQAETLVRQDRFSCDRVLDSKFSRVGRKPALYLNRSRISPNDRDTISSLSLANKLTVISRHTETVQGAHKQHIT